MSYELSFIPMNKGPVAIEGRAFAARHKFIYDNKMIHIIVVSHSLTTIYNVFDLVDATLGAAGCIDAGYVEGGRYHVTTWDSNELYKGLSAYREGLLFGIMDDMDKASIISRIEPDYDYNDKDKWLIRDIYNIDVNAPCMSEEDADRYTMIMNEEG